MVIRHPAVVGCERGSRDAFGETFSGYDGAEHWGLQWGTSIMQKGIASVTHRAIVKSLAAVAAQLSLRSA